MNNEENHIKNVSSKRQEYWDNYQKSWDKEVEEYAMEEPPEIDILAKEIDKSIRTWRDKLSFEFIIEELTKLGGAPCLLYDDDGRFSISGEGWQTVPMEDGPFDVEIGHFIKASKWKPTIREALNDYLDNVDNE